MKGWSAGIPIVLTALVVIVAVTGSSFTSPYSFKEFILDFITVMAALTVNAAMLTGIHARLSDEDKRLLKWMEILKLNQLSFKNKPNKDLPNQYEQISRLKKQIRTFRVVGESDGQIRLHLREEGWDPQIIELGLRRIK
ncbi:hypothetical protein JW868_01840 [Candidatus Woesearchaeota archaeon]|nr:hypothetical protein [Candidatus Woesearchaeota archaeon]